MAKKRAESEPEEKLDFENALEQLETIVHALEEGEGGLNETLARYERGVGLLRRCYQLLEKAERKIELLSAVDSQGQAATEPWDDRAPSGEEKAPGQSRRRGAGGAAPPKEGFDAGPQDVDDAEDTS